jgi:drug/metabolite transporter (DMT)-like permease
MTGLLERSGGQERREHPMAGPLIGTISVLTATALWAGIGSSVRLVHADSWTVIFWRGTFSGVTLLIVALGRSGKRLPREFCDLGHFGLTYVLASAIGTVLYILAINRTSVADVAVIYATMPFLTAAIAWCLLGESSGTPTLIASSLALIGVALTAGGASGFAPLAGQAIAAAMTLMYATQVLIMRRQYRSSILPIVCLASLVAASISLPFAHPFSISVKEILLLGVSGIIYGALGDLLFAYGTQLIPSVQSALLTTLDVPLSATFAWLAVGEVPVRLTMAGGAIIMVAVLGHVGLEQLQKETVCRRDARSGSHGSQPAGKSELPACQG